MADSDESSFWFNGYTLNLAALGLTVIALIMLLVSVNSNSWMTAYDDGEDYLFGLSEYGESERYRSYFESYDDDECTYLFPDDECNEASSAGTVGMIFLWVAILAITSSLVLLCLNNFGVYESNFAMISAFSCGGLAICGAIVWVIMFPEIEGLEDEGLGLGSSFYFTLIGGLFSISSGFCLLQSHKTIEPIWANVPTTVSHFTGFNQGILSRVSLGLVVGAVLVMLLSMFSNSWMTFSEDETELSFGLSEAEVSTEDGQRAIYDLSDPSCDEECGDAATAGTTGLIFLWLAVLSGIASIILICLNRSEMFESNYGMIAAFVCGGLAIIGVIIWAIIFPDMFEDIEGNLGISFYAVIYGGLLSIACGVIELKFIALDDV
tara:strand:- start:842 stop:1978 length:1137 start_codon:yes stop_codon:yes gene_type:complete